MTTINDVSQRLDMEFGLMPTAIHDRRSALERQYHERQERLTHLYAPALAQLRVMWEPRRDALLAQFKGAIHVMTAAQGDFANAVLSVDSPLARINLRFTFSHDSDVRNIILE